MTNDAFVVFREEEEEEKRLEMKVCLGALPMSGRGGDIVIGKNGITRRSPWAACTLTPSALMSEYFIVFTHQRWSYLRPVTESWMQHVSVDESLLRQNEYTEP